MIRMGCEIDGARSSTGIMLPLLDFDPFACEDFQIDSRILNHMETSNKIAGMQHAAASKVAVRKVSLVGAGMM